tara:strand:+ start:13084 stop:13839 length:756 start_codon:yes stop_codon:yes gene_type:complete
MENLKQLNLTIISDNHFSDPNLTTFENILRTTKKNIYNIAKGSNSNLLIEFEKNNYAIFKPKIGERSLHDFPIGTLYKREYASYLISLILGWPNVPPTSIVEIESIGIGSIQKIINNKGLNYFEIEKNIPNEFEKFTIFDSIINNADRKAGHCIIDESNKIWSIDHGVTFHELFKLRTVMFDIWENKISQNFIEDLLNLKNRINLQENHTMFAEFISRNELESLNKRIQNLIDQKSLPLINQYENIPWPLI